MDHTFFNDAKETLFGWDRGEKSRTALRPSDSTSDRLPGREGDFPKKVVNLSHLAAFVRENNMNRDETDSRMVALLTEHQLPLRHYVQSLLPGDFAAADVTQWANTTLWKKREEFALGTNFKAWAFAIARYEVLNYRKRQARDARLIFSSELEEVFAEELAEDSGDLENRQSALKDCLEKLKPVDRDLILHRYYERLPLQAYAVKTGRSVGGIKVTLHRIRNVLQGCIEANLRAREVDA